MMLIIDTVKTVGSTRVIEPSIHLPSDCLATLLFDKDSHNLFTTSHHIYSEFTQSHEGLLFICQLQTTLIRIYEAQTLRRDAGVGIWLFLLSLLLECLRLYSPQVPPQRAVEKLHQRLSCC